MVEITDDRSLWPPVDSDIWASRKHVLTDTTGRRICFFFCLFSEGKGIETAISTVAYLSEEEVFDTIPEMTRHIEQKYNLQEPVKLSWTWQGNPLGELEQ